MGERRVAELTVADLLAKAAAEDWPTSALSPRSQQSIVDDEPTEEIALVRPYYAALEQRRPTSGSA